MIRGDGQSLGSDLVESRDDTGIRIGGSNTSDICGASDLGDNGIDGGARGLASSSPRDCGGERDGRRVGVKEIEGETVGATDGVKDGWKVGRKVGMAEGRRWEHECMSRKDFQRSTESSSPCQ